MVYQISDFFSDVGGYLGLLLGQSILTGLHAVIDGWAIRRKCCGGNRKKLNKK